MKVQRFRTTSWAEFRELINDFDVQAFTLQLVAQTETVAGIAWEREVDQAKHFRESCCMSFTLVRHAKSPMLSAFLPFWLIQLMLPFAWLMELDPLNDAYGLIVGLLLAVTAHRAVMENTMAFVQRITNADMEFMWTILLPFLQNSLLSLFYKESTSVLTFFDGDFPCADGISELTVAHAIFAAQLVALFFRIGSQLLRARHSGKRISSVTQLESLSFVPGLPMTLKLYAQFFACRHELTDFVRRGAEVCGRVRG